MYNLVIVYTINDIKERIKLSEEIGKFIVLKKKGNSYWGICPFHMEKTPSFSVNDQKNFFYCFGCGVGGDFFSFMQKYKNLSFKESIETLSQQMGIHIKQFVGESQENRILKLIEKAKDFYKLNISGAISYLYNRKIKAQSIEKFELGFAPESLSIKYLINNGFSMQEITASGICSLNKDRFRNRLIFPIKDRKGRTIAFGGRTLNNDEPKYLNSSETEVFKKSFNLFGQQFLEYKQPVIVVEGFLDVIALQQIGISNVVATMGTNLSKENIYSLFKATEKVFLMFDGDESGLRAVEKNLENILQTLQPSRQVFICKLAKGEDPYDAAQKGYVYIKDILRKSLSLSQWIKNTWIKSVKTVEEHAVVLNKLSEIVESIGNRFVKEAYKEEFKNFKPKPKVNRDGFSKEEEIMCALFLLWKCWDRIIEELLSYSFASPIFEYVKNFIIDALISGDSPQSVNERVTKQWAPLKTSLIKKTSLIEMEEDALLNYFLNYLIRKI
jgi:DNA primase